MPQASEPSTGLAPPVEPPVGLGRAVIDSLRGARHDYAGLPLRRAVVLLGVPMALELFMQSAFGVVDIYFVGKLGPEAVAAVGLTESLIVLVFAVAMGLCVGATATTARRIGEGDPAGAARAAGQAVLLGVVFSLVVSLAGAVYASELLRAMGASYAVAAGAAYAAISFGGSATIFLIFINNAVFRGVGDAALAMRSLWLANALNMVLDPCLIFGWGPFPEWGLPGAAAATVIGRAAGVGFQFWALGSGDRRIRLDWSDFRPDGAVLRRLLRISSTASGQFFIATASWMGIMRIVALFGDSALAGYTIAIKVMHFAILPSWGLSNAAATLVGQNLGAGKPERAEQAVWVTGGYNLRLLAGVAIVFWIAAEPLIRFFSDDPAVIEIGVLALRISSFGYVFSAYAMVFSQAFNGAGDSGTPMRINFFVLWCLQLPAAYALARWTSFGLAGALAAIVFSMAAWAIIGAVVFRRGAWKRRRV